MLNAFAYTCGFSVCGALAGFRVTSLDLSKKYLDWGKQNFLLNSLDPASHDFIFGDVFDWFRRLAKKDRRFDVVLLDPPTFSRSKEHGSFSAEKDYGRLVAQAVPLVREGGILFCSTNAARLEPEAFCAAVRDAVGKQNRRILREHFAPQPPDFPIAPEAPGYLKTLWLELS
jgi:23S rRNA (cytosine1962-C5)-methyltransferase